jgi:hypothetical protein
MLWLKKGCFVNGDVDDDDDDDDDDGTLNFFCNFNLL